MTNKLRQKSPKPIKFHKLSKLPLLVTLGEVADALRLEEETVRRHFTSGKFPGIKIGGTWRMREEDLRALITPKTTAA